MPELSAQLTTDKQPIADRIVQEGLEVISRFVRVPTTRADRDPNVKHALDSATDPADETQTLRRMTAILTQAQPNLEDSRQREALGAVGRIAIEHIQTTHGPLVALELCARLYAGRVVPSGIVRAFHLANAASADGNGAAAVRICGRLINDSARLHWPLRSPEVQHMSPNGGALVDIEAMRRSVHVINEMPEATTAFARVLVDRAEFLGQRSKALSVGSSLSPGEFKKLCDESRAWVNLALRTAANLVTAESPYFVRDCLFDLEIAARKLPDWGDPLTVFSWTKSIRQNDQPVLAAINRVNRGLFAGQFDRWLVENAFCSDNEHSPSGDQRFQTYRRLVQACWDDLDARGFVRTPHFADKFGVSQAEYEPLIRLLETYGKDALTY